MTGGGGGERSDARLALLDAAIYADVFESAVALADLHRYARTAIDRDALERVLLEDEVVRESLAVDRDACALWDRAWLTEAHAERAGRAASLAHRAVRVAAVLRHLPFVRAIALTGSVAAGEAGRDSDVDLLIVVAPGRLATVFLVLGPVSRVVGRRVFCPNYYVSERHLEHDTASLYVAHELGQARVLVGPPELLVHANPRLAETFPNLSTVATPEPAPPGGRLQRALEAPLSGRAGDGFERLARAIAIRRLRVHHGSAVPPHVLTELVAGRSLRFHQGDNETRVPARYARRRAEVAARLAELDERLSASVAGRSA